MRWWGTLLALMAVPLPGTTQPQSNGGPHPGHEIARLERKVADLAEQLRQAEERISAAEHRMAQHAQFIEQSRWIGEVLKRNEDGDLVVEGANLVVRNGSGSTASSNGLGNVVIGYADAVYGSHNVILGEGHSVHGHGSIVSGRNNTVEGPGSVAIGSILSHVSPSGVVLGGFQHHIIGRHSIAIGGARNVIEGDETVVIGGFEIDAGASNSIHVGAEGLTANTMGPNH